jgi:hypothetical protein
MNFNSFPGIITVRGFAVVLNMACALVLSQPACGQQPATGYSRDLLSPLEKKLADKTSLEHPNIQPAAFGLEENFYILQDSAAAAWKYSKAASLNAYGSLAAGFQLQDENKALGAGQLGLELKWHKENKWSAAIGYSLAGMLPPSYLTTIADSLHVNPGYGYAVNDGNNLYHTHYTFGHLAYNQGKYFQFEIGKGKHFWGDGYRSMILSDVAAPYPYARITTKVWKLKYTNLWAQMRDISAGQPLRDARIKYTALHALSLNATKRFNVSVYEMVVWQDRDTNNHRTLDINYLNPIIFYRPVEYSVGSPDNVILAMSMRYKTKAGPEFYGQFLLDEFNLGKYRGGQKWWANKYGGQLGMKVFDIIIPGLNFQTEVNAARPFTYTHGSPVQAWSQLNQPLAHPLGANFLEWVSFVRYDWQKWKFVEQFNWAAYGRDRDVDGDGQIDNLGGNILRSYRNPYGQYHHELLQGLKSTYHYQSFTVSRMIHAGQNLEAFFTHVVRFEKNEFGRSLDNYFMAGIRMTGLLQPVTDF